MQARPSPLCARRPSPLCARLAPPLQPRCQQTTHSAQHARTAKTVSSTAARLRLASPMGSAVSAPLESCPRHRTHQAEPACATRRYAAPAPQSPANNVQVLAQPLGRGGAPQSAHGVLRGLGESARARRRRGAPDKGFVHDQAQCTSPTRGCDVPRRDGDLRQPSSDGVRRSPSSDVSPAPTGVRHYTPRWRSHADTTEYHRAVNT